MINDRDFALPTQSTSASGTNIVNLNFDRLYAIFSSKCLTTLDLCSIGESHAYLKEVVDEVFANRHKNYQVKLSKMGKREMSNTRRIFSNFGSLLSNILISIDKKCRNKESGSLLDLVSEFCSDKLESLELERVEITESQAIKLSPLFGKLKKISLEQCQVYAGKTLFSNCESLVELKLCVADFVDQRLPLENTFSKLERFEYHICTDSMSDSMWHDFFSRHKHLKVLNLCRPGCNDSHLLPMMANNCKQLVELGIDLSEGVNVEKNLSSILTIEHLKTLKIKCDFRNITKLVQRMKELRSLEFLSLWYVQGDSEFVPALSQLKRLQALELHQCHGLKNLNPLADLERLTELKIYSLDKCAFDLVYMIKRLINLKTLYLRARPFHMDQQMYLQIVDVLRERPLQDALQITCFTAKDFVADFQFDKILSITKP